MVFAFRAVRHVKPEEMDFLAQNNNRGEQEAVFDAHSGASVPPSSVLEVETFHLLYHHNHVSRELQTQKEHLSL